MSLVLALFYLKSLVVAMGSQIQVFTLGIFGKSGAEPKPVEGNPDYMLILPTSPREASRENTKRYIHQDSLSKSIFGLIKLI